MILHDPLGPVGLVSRAAQDVGALPGWVLGVLLVVTGLAMLVEVFGLVRE